MAMTAIAHQHQINRDYDRRLAQDLRSDQLRDDIDWERLEEIMADAPKAQRKEFWSNLLPLLDTYPRFLGKQSVQLIAEPLHDAVAEAIDAQVRKETDR
ncbi:hypothetical protein PSm6_44420 [Pseudomonas solani]|uniref:Uncharacterized protein n=1 Tax=Pseudomonas solani TaxID=2731552 RepID=A0ABM7LEM5_9PSED|nr:hypothetical protein [Pseudomonas solani]BCD88035.1 hypothetical protein PSm6_44420 [Pseudomonas solani]